MATKREKDILNNLDKRMAVLEDTIDRLETNHLSHLQKQIDKLSNKLQIQNINTLSNSNNTYNSKNSHNTVNYNI